eukprot:Lankesteria_metandrocarpae@DN8198_c0_g1_i1.p1
MATASLSPPEVAICQVFASTFCNDPDKRRNGEQQLAELSLTPGLLKSLTDIVRSSELELDIRLSAAIYMKNQIKRHWEANSLALIGTPVANPSTDRQAETYGDDEKQYIRSTLFETLVQVCEVASLRNMMEECVRLVAIYDYPERWPDILETVHATLTNASETPGQYVFCALITLRRLTAKYELDIRGDRCNLDSMIDRTFTLLLKLADRLIKGEDGKGTWAQNPGGAIMMKLICAIYWSSTQVALAKGGEVNRTLDLWMQLMESILMTPVPVDVINAAGGLKDNDQLSRLEQFKAKKRALQIVHRFFSRYGTDKGEYKEFGMAFVNGWSCRFITVCVQLLRNGHVPEWCMTMRMHSLVLQYLSQGVEIGKTYKFMKNDIREILSQMCFPLLCYSDMDEENWDLDPVEYVRTQSDMLCTFANPKESAVEFVQTVGRLRAKDFLGHIQSTAEEGIATYNADTSVPKSNDAYRKKDGALHILASIANRLLSEKRKTPVSDFLITQVFSEFASPNKFLRLRAIWTTERFLTPSSTIASGMNTQSTPPPQFKSIQDLVTAFHQMLAACGDSELPVRIQAGTSIKAFFQIAGEYNSPDLRVAIVQALPEVVRRLFNLMSDMDNEWVVTTLQCLVVNFEVEVIPHAAQLVEALATALSRFLGDGDSSSSAAFDEAADTHTAGMSIAETILSILTGSNCAVLKDESKSGVLLQSLCPLLSLMIHPDSPDYLDDGLTILASVVAHAPVISTDVWVFFERLHSAVCGGPATPQTQAPLMEIFSQGWAPDYLHQMLPVLHNFMMRDRASFASRLSTADNRPYLNLALEMSAKGFDGNGDPNGPKDGLVLMCYVFEAFLGHEPALDVYMKQCFEIQWKFLNTRKLDRDMKGVLLQVWCTMMLYSVEKFLNMLQETELISAVFSRFQNLSVLKNLESKKVYLLAFGQLLTLAVSKPQAVPKQLTDNIGGLVQSLVQEQRAMSDLRKKVEAKEESTDDEDSEDSEEELDEEEDAKDVNQRLQIRKWHTAPFGSLNTSDADEEDDEEDDDDDDESYDTDESTEDVMCLSPLDKVDEMLVFGMLLQNHRALFASTLTPDDLSALDSCVSQEIALQTERRAAMLQ